MKRWLSLLLVATLVFLLGMLGFSLWDKPPSALERVTWSAEAQWITSRQPSYRFYARNTFYVSDKVEKAWLRLSADNDFILYVNGQLIAREANVTNNALGFANALSNDFQRINDSLPYHIVGGPQYLMSHTKDWRLTAYIDLTNYLRPGKNAIAIEIQTARKNPRIVVEGAVYAAPGESIKLTTGATTWRTATLAESHQELQWFDVDFPDRGWSEAAAIGSVEEPTYSRLSQQMFDRPLQGSWISGTASPQGEVWLRGSWYVPQKQLMRAFIRFAADGKYALMLNGTLVNRYGDDNGDRLHLYEVTKLLRTGENILAVRLASPLEEDGSSIAQNYPLRFFLDGWVETTKHVVTAPIITDSTWEYLAQPVSDWFSGKGDAQPAIVVGAPDPQAFQRVLEGDAYLFNYPNNLLQYGLWRFGGIGFALILAWGLGRFWLGYKDNWGDSFEAGVSLLLPGILFLVGIGLLKHRYAEEERGLLFVQPASISLIAAGFLGILCLSLLWSWMAQRTRERDSLEPRKLFRVRWRWFLLGLIASCALGLVKPGLLLSQSPTMFLVIIGSIAIACALLFWQPVRSLLCNWYIRLQTCLSWNQWLWLGLIVSVGFGLRVYNLGFQDFDSDENTSLDAIRGILRTGTPEASSGIWYTRSPAFHYMVALWLRLVGDSAVNARFFSVLWGTATLVIFFFLARKLTGRVWIALLITAILAIDPLEIYVSRFIRFYQVVQCLSLLAFWFFFKGFIEREGKRFQFGFFIAITLTMLSQEVTLTLIPGFIIGFLFFYRPIRLSVDWSIILSSITALGILVYDIIFFSIKCLTPLVGLSTKTDSIIKPHLLDVTELTYSFFAGPHRMYTIYSFFFVLGLAYFIKRQETKLLFLYATIIVNLISLTLLVMQIATRYAYPIYPLFILLSVYSAICITESLGQKFEEILTGILPLKNIGVCLICLLLASNVEPDRVIAGYQVAIARRSTEVFEYIRERRQPEDKVVSSLPAAAAVVLGGLDYYVPPGSISFDGIYQHEGKVIDRWGGGLVVSNVDMMNQVLEQANRVWIHVDDHRPPKAPEIAQLDNYLQTLGQPVFETFGVRLRLWERDNAILPRIPNQGKDIGNY